MPRHVLQSAASGRRFISWQIAAPNFITLLALCAGLTGLVMAADGRIGDAVACILIAALLDGCDGRVARLTGGSSKFGAELDSLADVGELSARYRPLSSTNGDCRNSVWRGGFRAWHWHPAAHCAWRGSMS